MPQNPRSTLRETAQAAEAQIAQFFLDALQADRQAKIKCKCGRWAEGEVADWRSRLDAVKTLLDQGYGKPPATQQPSINLDADPEKLTPEERAELRTRIEQALQELEANRKAA